MKKILTAAVGMLALSLAPASAADLAARPYTKAPAPMIAAMYDWSGFYIGINGGGAWSRKCWDINNALGIIINPAVAEGCHDATGGVVGGQFGYRWQSAAWVFGLDAQGNWANLRGSSTSSPAALTAAITNTSRIDAIGLFTGQVGYAVNNVLFYVKGGAMGVNDKYEGSVTATGVVFDRGSETRWGGAVGAGIDFGITPNVVLGVDYVHGFLGSRDVTFNSTVGGALSRVDRIRQDVDMVTARLSYKFGGGAVIAKY
ncbi:MAG: outer membrane beta-barrel protein [bacterium]|nr:outer membrane beta-barrel protein [bacterium]